MLKAQIFGTYVNETKAITTDANGNLISAQSNPSLGGFWPEPGTLTTLTTIGEPTEYKVDSRGNLSTRGPTTTDEGSVREDFPGTTIYHIDTGTVTFTNNSKVITGVSTNFADGTDSYSDFIKLSTDPDTAYSRIESIISNTEILLKNVYTGSSGSGTANVTKFKPVTGTGGSITVANSLCSITSGTTSSAITKIFRNIDYCPLIFTGNTAVSQRIANQTGYLGLTDDTLVPTISAYFQFDGTNELSIKTVTQSSVQATDIETNTIALLQPTSLQRGYRIDLSQEFVNFYIDDILVSTHKAHIPGPYAYMDGFAGWLNGTSPASSTTMAVNSIYVGNVDSLIVAKDLISSTANHESLGGFWPEPGTLTTQTTIGEPTDYKVDAQGNLATRGPITTDEGSVREDFPGTTIYHIDVGTITFTNNSNVVRGVGTNFADGTDALGDFIKLSTDPDTAYSKIESPISDAELLLENVYTGSSVSGPGYVTKFKPVTGAGGAITVANSLCSIASGTTTSSITKIFRNIDYGPLVFTANTAISQRIVNQTGYIGLTDDAIAPTISAYFQFDGTNELIIKTVTQSSAQVTDIETNTITLLTTTSAERRYRIDLSQEYVAFYVDEVLVSTHKTHIPGPYAYMDGFTGWVNGASPASSTTMAVNSIFIGNIDALQLSTGLINLPVVVSNSAISPVYVSNSEFQISLQITRPANTTNYTAGDLINNSGSTVLPPFDFSTLGNLQNRFIDVTTVIIISNNGGISTSNQLVPIVHLFNANTITGSTLTDNTPFNPSYTEVIAKRVLSIGSPYTPIIIGTGCYLLNLINFSELLRLDATCKTYLALLAGNAYNPISGETITVILKGNL